MKRSQYKAWHVVFPDYDVWMYFLNLSSCVALHK